MDMAYSAWWRPRHDLISLKMLQMNGGIFKRQ